MNQVIAGARRVSRYVSPRSRQHLSRPQGPARRSSGKYSYAIFESSQQVDPQDWYSVCDVRVNPYLDLRFVRVVEESLRDTCGVWCAIFYDADRQPVACACYSQFPVDGALLAPPGVQRFCGAVRRVFPRFLHYRVLLGGLPVSTQHPHGQLAIAPGADRAKITALLDEVAQRLAKSARSRLIAFKEFGEQTADVLAPLQEQGYLRADSVVNYVVKCEHASLDEYVQAQNGKARYGIRKIFKKFEEVGLRCVHLKGGDGVDRLYTDEVHRLYEMMYEKATTKFEKLPAEFFRELARRMPEESRFTFLYKGDRVVGFGSAVSCPACHYLLYCGVDPELGAEGELYFNMIYRSLGQAFEHRPDAISLGASADDLKRRLGGTPAPLYFYLKAVSKVSSLLLNGAAKLLFH